MNNLQEFQHYIQESLDSNTFVRLTLSKNSSRKATLKKVTIRLITIRDVLQFSFIYHHTNKDITKNLLLEEGMKSIQDLLSEHFLIATLFSINRDIILQFSKKRKALINFKSPTFQKLPSRNHDKTKNYLIHQSAFLYELGIINKSGSIKKDKGGKLRQINKFVEIIDTLLRQNTYLRDKKAIKVIDMGSGKGYLTFALYDYFEKNWGFSPNVTAVEIRPDLVEKCNAIAQQIGFKNLSFQKGYINDFPLQNTDVLIALHACDTATDEAIFKGIDANAQLIICAPCCHKQIRKQITKSQSLQAVLDFGILKERQAELITDTMRALLLELQGYTTKVFEFISTEHTGKNIMIVGQKHNRAIQSEKIQSKINNIKKEFGIEYHHLERLLEVPIK